MSTDIGESLMQSWLRHIKRCSLVQTNWKVAMHLGFNQQKSNALLAKIKAEYPFFCPKMDAAQILRQLEIDALGCQIASQTKYYACDIAFHTDGLHYSKGDDAVPAKLLRMILCMHGVLEAKEAEIVFATPSFVSVKDKTNLEAFIASLNDCLQNKWGLSTYRVKLYAEYEFETGILNPTMYLVNDIKDTSEVFVRACQLISITRQASNTSGPSATGAGTVFIHTPTGVIDVTEWKAQDLLEQYVLPILSEMCKTKLKPYFEKDASKKMFGGNYPLLNPTPVTTTVKGKSKDRCYKVAYYLAKTKQNVYVSNDCDKSQIVSWINDALKP